MAGSDYRKCDECGAKAFYDSNLNYDFDKCDEFGRPKLEYVGDMAVLCDECAKTFEVLIAPRKPNALRKPEKAAGEG